MKEISDISGYYIESNGDVFSLKFPNGKSGTKKLRKLNPSIGSGGYVSIGLCAGKKGKLKRFLIHRLVCIAFIPNPRNKPCVNHVDGNKQNNTISNLEWCTHKENMAHAKKNGLSTPPPINIMRGEDNPNTHLSEKDVVEMRVSYSKGGISQRQLALNYNIKQSSVWKILKRLSWQHV